MKDRLSTIHEVRRLRDCRRLVVVAHPDDETLWAGAAMSREPGWGVVCLTNRSTRVRRRAFRKALKALGVAGAIFDVPDRRSGEVTESDREEIRAIVAPLLGQAHVQSVLTHSPDGETGHGIHIAISNVVTSLIDPTRLQYFSFDPSLDLRRDDPTAWARKRAALECYFGSLEAAPGNDGLHVRLSVYESPVPAAQYARPNELIQSIYRGSSVPAGSIEKGIAE